MRGVTLEDLAPESPARAISPQPPHGGAIGIHRPSVGHTHQPAPGWLSCVITNESEPASILLSHDRLEPRGLHLGPYH